MSALGAGRVAAGTAPALGLAGDGPDVVTELAVALWRPTTRTVSPCALIVAGTGFAGAP